MAKVLIVYWSGTGNTEKMADFVEIGVREAGAEVVKKFVTDASAAEIAGFDAVALGCPSMGAEELDPDMELFSDEAKPLLAGKKLALFGSYDWGEGEWMELWEERLADAGATFVSEHGLIIRNTPEGSDEQLCKDLGALLA